MTEYLKNNKLFCVTILVIIFITSFYIINNKKDIIQDYLPKKNPLFNFSNLSWTLSTSTHWGARDSHTTFVFDDRMWVLGGLDVKEFLKKDEPNYEKAIYYNDVWYTEDGFSWTRGIEHANFPPIRSTSIFEVDGKLFMVGGYSPIEEVHYNNGLWTSTDGINWKKENISLPFKEREGQQVIKFKDKYLLIGGVNYSTKQRFNDIWQSSDGYNWSVLATSTAWKPRWDMEVSEFNGKLWLTGGMTSVEEPFGDEWVSDDGIYWKLVYESAPFGKRQGHSFIVSNGYLMLIGGIRDTNESAGEVWATQDGVNWVSQKNTWTSKEDLSSVIFKNKIWILGGMNYNYTWSNDIFYSNYEYFDGSTINKETFKKVSENVLYKGNCPLSENASSSVELSKVFVNRENRLPEGFVPKDLVELNGVVRTEKEITCLDRLAAEKLVSMFKQAEKENLYLGITYGYRTPEKQQEMLDFWIKETNLEEALEGIAKPYYSEHQLGMGADLTGKSIDYLGVSKKFAGTTESNWLEKNAHLFGYTLSYPENKTDVTGYIYEPWHYRYVGADIAKRLHDKKTNFSEYQKIK